jgi:hypothetical protein
MGLEVVLLVGYFEKSAGGEFLRVVGVLFFVRLK